MRAPGLACVVLLVSLGLTAPVALAQAQQPRPGVMQSAILTVDSERMYAESDFGKATAKEFEARGAELSAENRGIEAELTAEEKALTEKRPDMDPADFKVLANAFDEKVQATRRTQEAKTRKLNAALEERRRVFLSATAPVFEDLMRSAGAVVVLERRTVFFSANSVDITDAAVVRLNAVLGDGGDVVTVPKP